MRINKFYSVCLP